MLKIMENLYERSLAIRSNGLRHLSEDYQDISRRIAGEEYFIVTINVLGKGVFVIVDFTSKQSDHLEDIDDYSIKLYNKFSNGEMNLC